MFSPLTEATATTTVTMLCKLWAAKGQEKLEMVMITKMREKIYLNRLVVRCKQMIHCGDA